jgi:hypothetical protein
MVKEIKEKRIIKQIGNIVKPGERYIHPITLQIRKIDKSSKNFVPTEFHFNPEGKLELDTFVDNIDTTNLTKKDLQLEMLLPKTVYNEAYLLHIHNISNIDSLNNYIDNEISKNTSFETINRLINVFTIYKIEEFKKNNNSLIEIYQKIFKNLLKKNFKNERMNILIQNYLNKNKNDLFDFNIGVYILTNI